jgi:hypothetical protein
VNVLLPGRAPQDPAKVGIWITVVTPTALSLGTPADSPQKSGYCPRLSRELHGVRVYAGVLQVIFYVQFTALRA